MPSSEIPKRDSGSHVSKSGLNPHKIVGIMLDDTSKQRLMHEYVGKHAKRMHRSKESQTGGIKQAWQATSHGAEKGVYQALQHHKGVSHKCLHPNKPYEGWMQPHKQWAPRTNKHKPMKGAKPGKAEI